MNVGIVIFDEVELLDMAGPYEVFTTAARVHARSQPAGAPPLFRVFTLAPAAMRCAPAQACGCSRTSCCTSTRRWPAPSCPAAWSTPSWAGPS